MYGCVCVSWDLCDRDMYPASQKLGKLLGSAE